MASTTTLTAADILNRWAQYAEYDPDQKKFNLLSENYIYHRACKFIEGIVSNYDPSGTLALIYAKGVFEKVMSEAKTSVLALLEDPTLLDETREMWELFHSQEEEAIEAGLLTSIEHLEAQVAGQKMLGSMSREDIRKTIYKAVEAIVEELQGCRTELFKRGGPIGPVEKFSTSVHVFNRLSECLLALEATEDGLYLCYIAQNNTADGYFGFFLKNNGNIVSINERVDEAYIGQHAGGRNGRWTDGKKYSLFPYELIFSYADNDYLGYYAKHIIDNEKLAFSAIGPEGYIPIVLAMVILSQKFRGTQPEGEVVMVNTLLPTNILAAAHQEETALVLANAKSSALATNHAAFTPGFSYDEAVKGTYPERIYKEHGKPETHRTAFYQTESAKLFIDLYRGDFQYNPEELLQDPGLKMLMAGKRVEKEDTLFTPELIGTERRLNDQAYYEVRKQLAEHIRDRMRDEYVAFGGVNAIREWWTNEIRRNAERIDVLAKKAYQYSLQEGEDDSLFSDDVEAEFVKNCISILVSTSGALPYGSYAPKVLNSRQHIGKGPERYLCRIKPGVVAKVFVTVEMRTWKDIEFLINGQLPKIVVGWEKERRITPGNPLLDATDLVSSVGTPLEYYELRQNDRYSDAVCYTKRLSAPEKPYAYGVNFGFSAAYSKRGIAAK